MNNTPPNNLVSSFLKRKGSRDSFQEGAWRPVRAHACRRAAQWQPGASGLAARSTESPLLVAPRATGSSLLNTSSSKPPPAPLELPNHRAIKVMALAQLTPWTLSQTARSAQKVPAKKTQCPQVPVSSLVHVCLATGTAMCARALLRETRTSRSVSTCPWLPVASINILIWVHTVAAAHSHQGRESLWSEWAGWLPSKHNALSWGLGVGFFLLNSLSCGQRPALPCKGR